MPKKNTPKDQSQEVVNEQSTPQNDETVALLAEERAKRIQIMADFENYKKRMEGERAMFGAIANIGLIKELLEISDDISLALGDESLDLDRSKESLSIAKEKLIAAAKASGVEKIEVNVGDEFNKEYMEAVSVVENNEMKNKVIAVVSSAYKYSSNGSIIKSAKVIVGK